MFRGVPFKDHMLTFNTPRPGIWASTRARHPRPEAESVQGHGRSAYNDRVVGFGSVKAFTTAYTHTRHGRGRCGL
jgi:hypothetical protein